MNARIEGVVRGRWNPTQLTRVPSPPPIWRLTRSYLAVAASGANAVVGPATPRSAGRALPAAPSQPLPPFQDIYSLAVLLWELLSGQRPWTGCAVVEVACLVSMKGRRPPLDQLPPKRCPTKLRTLMQHCWDPDPCRRPAAAEVAKELALVLQVLRLGESCFVGRGRNG